MASDYGYELINLVEIDQPKCSLTYGEGACEAVLGESGSAKCFNTRFTCQDPSNYDPSETVTIRIALGQEGLDQYGYVLPVLSGAPNITPMKLNIGSMDRSASAFGQRERLSFNCLDPKHSDVLFDPYRLERATGAAGTTYDPYEQGSLWGKWLARNPYYEGYPVRHYQGEVGQDVEDMEVAHYLLDRVTRRNGRVSFTAKDLFSKVEARKAKAPRASRGELSGDITDTATSFSVIGPPGEYPTTGSFRVRIGDETIAVGSASYSEPTYSFSSITRGVLGSDPDEHDEDDTVQLVLSYDAEEAQDIVEDLLVEYAGVDASLIPKAEWDAEAAENFSALYSAHITEPTPVEDLVGELAEQVGFTIWPDVRDNEVKLRAITPALDLGGDEPVNDSGWILDGSLSLRDMTEQRVSQVWVYFGQVNPNESLDDATNYRTRLVIADGEAELDEQYGTASVREVYSRWIPALGRAQAQQAGNRIISIFRDPPFRASFQVWQSRRDSFSLTRAFRLRTDERQDVLGRQATTVHVPMQLARDNDRVNVVSQELSFFTPPDEARKIFIDDDTTDFDLRAAYDQLYVAPASGIVVNCFIANGVVVHGAPAFDVGSWPSGVEINIFIGSGATIAGRGGQGGFGGSGDPFGPIEGADGEDGGIGIYARYPVTIENSATIAGGGGGGGGGHGGGPNEFVNEVGGNGGGGAAFGVGPGTGPPNAGEDGGLTTGGAGGEGIGGGQDAGDGGNAAQVGQDAQESITGASGEGGAAGVAVDGDSFITWDTLGTIIGDRIN